MSDPYTPSAPSAPSFPWNLVKDGEVFNADAVMRSATPGNGLFKLCADGIAYLYSAATASAVALAKQTASSGDTLIGVLGITSATTARLGAASSGTLRQTLQFIFNNAITDLDSTSIGAGVSTYTADATTNRTYHVDTPTQSVLTITLKSTSPVPPAGSEIHIAAYSIANTKSVIIARENATQITIMTGLAAGQNFGSGRYKFIAGSWRLMSGDGLASQWAASFPDSINSA